MTFINAQYERVGRRFEEDTARVVFDANDDCFCCGLGADGDDNPCVR
jgi:hypothetical protein